MDIFVKKLNQTFTVDNPPQVTLDYWLSYGAKQAANDQLASLQRKNYADDQSFEEACWDKLLDWQKRMEAGDVPGHRDPKATTMKKSVEFARSLNEKELAEFLAMIQAQNAPVAEAA